jgi:hypothetical protein
MTKPIVAFRNFANAPKGGTVYVVLFVRTYLLNLSLLFHILSVGEILYKGSSRNTVEGLWKPVQGG